MPTPGPDSAGSSGRFCDKLLQALPHPACCTELDGTVVSWNDSFVEALKLRPGTLAGQPIADALTGLVVPGDLPAPREYQQCSCDADCRGRPHHVTLKRTLVLDPEGGPALLMYTLAPVTTTVAADLYLKNLAIDSSLAAVIMGDLEGVVTYVNPAFTAVTGLSADWVVGRHLLDVVKEGEQVASIIQAVRDTGSWTGEYPAVRDSGERYWIEMQASFVRDKQGHPTGMMASFINITQRKQALEALRASESNYRTLVQSANSIIVRLDRSGNITFINEFAQRFFGYSEAEIVGKPALLTIIPATNGAGVDLTEFVGDLLKHPDRYANSENENITRDGRRVWISWANKALLDENGDFVELLAIGNDITARKQVEERLRISEAAIESSLNAIGIADLNGTIQYVNPAYRRLWALESPHEVVGRHISEFMVSTTPGEVLSAVGTAGVWHGERLGQRRNGEPFFIEISVNLVRDDRGQPLCVMASFMDVTQRRLAEQELRQFKTISDRANYGTVILDEAGRMLYCNETFAAMHGYTIAELVGRPVRMLHTHEQWQVAADLASQLIRDGAVDTVRMMRTRKDGSVFAGLMNISRIVGEDGTVLHPATVVDITDLDEAIHDLAAEKDRLAVTLRSISDGVIATDIDGRVTLLNAEAERLTGRSQEQALGHPAAEVYRCAPPDLDQPRPHPVDQVLATGQPVPAMQGLVLRLASGVERLAADSAAPISDANGKMIGVVLVFRDITEHERLREAVYQAHKLESLGLLAGGIAHDFNNMLTSLLGQINLARSQTELANVDSALREAEAAALQARHLSQQLLTFSRGGSPVKSPLWPGEVIRNATSFALSGSNVAADFDLPDDLWPIEADEGQLIRVINNLIINAVQAMQRGGTVHVRASNRQLDRPRRSPVPPGRYVQAQIQDHGPGLPPDVVQRVFDPYFTTRDTGSGLGLTIAYSIVRNHGGHLTVRSTPGQGTTFSFLLPATHKRPASPGASQDAAPGGTGRVLVMDDDPSIRRLAQAMLNQLGYTPSVAKDGDEAVASFLTANHPPYRAAILDLTIKGGEGGAETISKLRQVHPDAKMIACSGYCNDPVMANYRDYGFDGVITKPYRLQDLAQALNQVL